MNIPFGVLDDFFVWMGWILSLGLLGVALKTAPWHKVRGDRSAQGVFFATGLLIFALWSVKAGIGPGLSFHFIGATVVTLMFGWQFAAILFVLVMLAMVAVEQVGIDALGMNWLIVAAIPIGVTWFVLKLSYQFLPRHFFVYTFLNAFLVGALSMIVTVLVLSVVLVSGHVISWDKLSYQFLPMLPMMAGPEAFINGFIMTVLVLYRVDWVSTFTDEQYLKGK